MRHWKPLPGVSPLPVIKFCGEFLLIVPARHEQPPPQFLLTCVAVQLTLKIGIVLVPPTVLDRFPAASPWTDQALPTDFETLTLTVTEAFAETTGTVVGFASGKVIEDGVIASARLIAARRGDGSSTHIIAAKIAAVQLFFFP